MSILNLLAGIPVNANLRVKISELEAKMATLNEQVSNLQAENAHLKTENAQLTEQVNRLTKRLDRPKVADGDYDPFNSGGGPNGWMVR